jgi:hypothetical protein
VLGGRLAEDPERVGALALDWVGTSLVDVGAYAQALRERLEAEGRAWHGGYEAEGSSPCARRPAVGSVRPFDR